MAAPLTLRARVPGAVSAVVDSVGGRPAVVVSFDASHKRGRADPRPTATRWPRRRGVARQERVPLVVFMASSGADVGEGLDALVGLGRRRPRDGAQLRHRAHRHGGDGPGGVRAGPAAGAGRRGDHDPRGLRLRVRSPHGHRLHRCPDLGRRPGRSRHPRPLQRGRRPHRRRAARTAASWSRSCWPTCPATTTRSRRRWRTDDPADRATPEAGALLPASPTGSYDVRAVARAIVDDRSCSSCAPAGPPTWSPRWPPSAAARSASWPTSPRPWPARSTSPPRRRAPAS